MQPHKIGVTPVLIMTAITLSIGAATTWALGLVEPRPTPDAHATAEPSQPAQARLALTGRESPAQRVIGALLGDSVSWGAKVPAPLGCATTPSSYSASTPTQSAHAYTAGMAVDALEALASCGTRTTVNGTPGVLMAAPGGAVLAWTRGDVLVTVSGPSRDDASANLLDARLVDLLAPVCPNMSPTSDDSLRNPLSTDYRGNWQTQQVTIDTIAAPLPQASPTPTASNSANVAPDASPTIASISDPLPTPEDLATPTLPVGVEGPPLPPAMDKPIAPVSPGDQVVSREITIETADPVGPGCGWDFTLQSAPTQDTDAMAQQAEVLARSTKTDLLTAQQEWAVKAAAYLRAANEFAAQVSAWNTYVDEVKGVTRLWQQQKRALDTYAADLETYNTAVTAQQTFLARQVSARTQYDKDIAACQTPAPTPTPTPTPTLPPNTLPATKTSGCNPPRPTILDQAPPAVPAAPVPPTLWKAP